MARSLVIVVSDDFTITQEARRWAHDHNVEVETFSTQQWSEDIEKPSFRAQLKSDPIVLSTGSEHSNVLPFPGTKEVRPESSKVITINELESMAIENAIFEYKGNLTEAARALGIGRATLYRKVKQYNIDPSRARNRMPKAA
jgi:DNA-binding NtrC family response regulator